MKDFMKCVTLIWVFVVLMSFIVSCSNAVIETTETATVLDVKEIENGYILALSIKYHGYEWLEDARLKVAEYHRYKDVNELPLYAVYNSNSYHECISFTLNGRRIVKVYLTKELNKSLYEEMTAAQEQIETLETTTANPIE